ncbi:MAG TPA: hypothetical protein G4N92_04360 [Anaerolineae bacterium]|nr:hypothetical protein [Anaerolineae bacterium]
MPKTKTIPLFACLLFVIVFMLYIPFGFKNLPQMEEWGILRYYDQYKQFIHPHSFTFLRPFYDIPFKISYLISPDTLIGFNIFQALLLFVKGICIFGIVYLLSDGDDILSAAIALLAAFFSGDKGLFSFRTINHLMSSILFLMAFYIILYMWVKRKTTAFLIILFLILINFSIGINESSIPLFFFMPLILLWKEKGVTKRLIKFFALWYLSIIPLLAFIYIPNLLNTPFAGTYQSESLALDNSLSAIINSIINACKINLIHGWRVRTTLLNLDTSSIFFSLSILAAILTLGFFFLSDTSQKGSLNKPKLFNIEFALIGLIIIVLGFLPFAVTRFRYDQWRVYFLTSFGAAVVVVNISLLFLKAITKNRVWLLSILVGVLIFTSIYSLFIQQDIFVESSNILKRLTADISRQAPEFKQGTYIIIINMPKINDYIKKTYFRYQFIDNFLSYIYQDYNNVLEVDFCDLSEDGKLYSEIDYHLSEYICAQGNLAVPHDSVLIFTYKEDIGFDLIQKIPENMILQDKGWEFYNPNRLIDFSSEIPIRARKTVSIRE